MNSTKKLTIKWGKEVININTISSTIADLKQELINQTNVSPDRQKLLLKGTCFH